MITKEELDLIVSKINELTEPGEYLGYLHKYNIGEKLEEDLLEYGDGPYVMSCPQGWIDVTFNAESNSIGILSKKTDDPDWTFREFNLFTPPIDLKPFDVVLYKPKNQEGLVKSVTKDGVFVLFRIQSTAALCKFEDLEKL